MADNKIRGGVWPRKGFSGKLTIGEKIYYPSMVEIQLAKPNPKAPAYTMYLIDAAADTVSKTGIWRVEGKGQKVGNGSIIIDGVDYWINVFKAGADKKPGGPPLDIVLEPKAEDSQADTGNPPPDDDIPF